MSCLILALCAQMELYGRFAIGYKVDEHEAIKVDVYWDGLDKSKRTKKYYFGHDVSAFVEVGFEAPSGVSFGLKHDSQPLSGAPFNNDTEYHKTEIFVGYKLGGIK